MKAKGILIPIPIVTGVETESKLMKLSYFFDFLTSI